MSSKDIKQPQEALIGLIYRHLKDNGYKKAANVLRKHAPQVKTGKVKASLGEIYNKWTSNEAGKVVTDDVESDSSESSDAPPWPPDVQTPELSPASTNAQGPTKPVNRNIRKTSGSKKKVKKETVTKSKKSQKSGSEDGGPKSHIAAVPITPESASDSDSSLDVEKWTKLVSQLSDADITKMEVLSNFVESPGSSPGTSVEMGKEWKAKNGKTAAKKTKSKTVDISVETKATQTSSEKSKDKTTAAVSKGPKMPSKTSGHKSKTSKSAKTTNAKSITSEKSETHEPAGNHEANGVLKTDSKGTKADQNCSKAENAETSSSQNSSKKAKKKKVKRRSVAANIANPSAKDNLLNTKVKKKKNANEAAEDGSRDANLEIADAHLTTEEPSKKAKKSLWKSVVEPLPDETSKKLKTKKSKSPADLDAATSEKDDVLQESDPPSKSLPEESKAPSGKSKKAKNVIAEPEQVETPFKMATNPTKGSSKKRRTSSNDVLSETQLMKSPTKSRKSQVKSGDDDDDDDDDGGLGNEEPSSQDIKTPSKKRKRKEKEANDVSASEEATPEPKKSKKKKKEAEEVDEDFHEPSEEAPEEPSQKKKKKKREKEIESEETEPHDDVAADELIVHKKKKKSSTEKHRDEASGPDTDQEHDVNA